MSTTTTPVWTQAVSVISAQVLARGSVLRGTLDLRGTTDKHGARVYMRMGRGGATAITGGTNPGVKFSVRARDNNGAVGSNHPIGVERVSLIAAAVVTTCATSNSNSGQSALNVASIGAIVGGDFICIQDAGGGVTRLEFHRVSKVATGVLTLDNNLEYTHTTGQADTVRSMASIFPPILVSGGTLYELVVDYGDATAGDSIVVVAHAQTYDSLLNT